MTKIRRKRPADSRKPKVRPVVAVVWYPNHDEWSAMKDLAVDPHRLEDTYESWLVMFEKSMVNIEAAGIAPVRAEFNVADYKLWCESEAKPFDAESRSHFAALLQQQAAADLE